MAKNKSSHYKTDVTVDEAKVETLEPCVQMVKDNWEKWDSYWSAKMDKFGEYHERWLGKPPERDEDWQANFHKRLTWQAEKVLVARFFPALFPVSAPIDTEVTETVNETQGILGKSIVAHWFKIGNFSKEFLKAMRSAAIYGTGLFEDDWYQRTEKIPEKVEKQIPDFRPMVGENGEKVLDEDGNIKAIQTGVRTVIREESKRKVVEDRYRVRKANIFAWRIHPHKISDDDDYPAIKVEYITYDDLLERQSEFAKYGVSGFENMDKIKADRFKINEGDAKRLQKDGEFSDDKNPRLELLHYWGLYAEQDGDEGYKENVEKRPMWITIVNRKYRLKKSDNPFWHKKPPLFHIVWTEDEKPSYYGIGVAEIGADAEDRANLAVNTRADVKKKNVKGTGWYNATDKKLKKSHAMNNTPGFMRPCSDVFKAFKYDIPPPLDIGDYKEEETAVNDHREITGATTALLPSADITQQPKTKGGLELITGAATERLKPDLLMMELMGIRKMANRGFLLTRQFFSKPEAIELVASADVRQRLNLDKIYTISPEKIIGKVKFYGTGLSESLEKTQKIDKLLKYTEITSKIPQMQAITNYQAVAKRIALLIGFENVEELIQVAPQIPGLPPQLAQLGQQGQMPQQMPGAGLPGGTQGLPDNILAQIASQIGQGQV